MRLTYLSITNFRNIEHAELTFEDRRQFFCGSNGQGKTNLLESVGMISAMRSFRTTKRTPLIRHGEAHATIKAEIELKDAETTKVDIHLSRNLRKAFIDEAPVEKFSEFIGKFPTVILSSEDIQLLRGQPSLRRRFFDLILSFGEPEYLSTLQKYHHILKQRNALLKMDNPLPQLTAFDHQLANQASHLIHIRKEAILQFKKHLQKFYEQIAQNENEVPDLIYDPSRSSESPDDFMILLQHSLERDLHSGSTTIGPHRDDFPLLLNENLAVEFASEGQQRALVLALRFAQFSYFREKSGTTPILLADDILGELDPGRRERFWHAIAPETHLIATGTSLPDDRDPWQLFQVDHGHFS